MIRTVVFDLDDTLYREHDFVRSGFEAVGAWVRRTLHREAFFETAWALFEAGRRGTVFNDALRELGLPPDAAHIDEMVRQYRGHRPTLTLLPDARHALDACARDRNLAVLTDGYLAVQQGKVRALGLEARVDHIVYTDALGRAYWKPHPLPFKEITTRLGCPSGSCVYVGDNPAKDFIGARGLGWLTVRIRRDTGEYGHLKPAKGYEPHHTIHDLRELLALI
jgi:putative hydrolase of the HAD superfamily